MKIKSWEQAKEIVLNRHLHDTVNMSDVLEFLKSKTGKTKEILLNELEEYKAIEKESRDNIFLFNKMTVKNWSVLYVNWYRLINLYKKILDGIKVSKRSHFSDSQRR